MSNLSSAFLNKRDLTQLKREELEDLDYHLQYRRRSLEQKMTQLKRDMADIDADRQKLSLELTKQFQA
ncbi:MAG: hypothetical protein ACXVP5_04165 [Tumebacillaceae bacterium]